MSVKTTFLALNGSGGAFKAVVADRTVRRLIITEDAAAALQGLQFQLPDDNFVQIYQTQAGPPPAVVTLGSEIALQTGGGSAIGHGPQQDPGGKTIAGTTMLKLRSASATVTNVWVKEYDV